MAQQQRMTALGIAARGGRIGYTLIARGGDGALRLLAQGQCARPEALAALQGEDGAPLLAASVIGTGCSSMSPALTALAAGTPVVHINPLEAYLLAPLAEHIGLNAPYVALVASARHTALVRVRTPGEYAVLGQALDISAGAVFDALACQLGMDLPGGPTIARLADFGNPKACDLLPTAAGTDTLDFSFAALQAAALQRARELEGSPCEQPRADLAASVQEAVIAQLAAQTARTLQRTGISQLALGGGVACNTALRERLATVGTVYPVTALARHRSARVALAALLRHATCAGAAPVSPAAAPAAALAGSGTQRPA